MRRISDVFVQAGRRAWWAARRSRGRRSDEEVASSADVQLEALVALLEDALRASPQPRAAGRAGT
jgi:hypothetical protein